MAIDPRFPTALPALLLALSFGFVAQVAAQDPANADAAPPTDPARIGGQAVAPYRSNASPAPTARPETMQRLQRAEDLQRRLVAQWGAGEALPSDERIDLQRLLDRSSGLIDESWNKLGRRTATSAPAAPAAPQSAQTVAPEFDSLASLQQDPRMREGAQQAREAMEAMQRTLLPMLQALRDDIDAELRGAANRSR